FHKFAGRPLSTTTEQKQDRQFCILLPKKERGYTPFSLLTNFTAASRATSAASALPWITAVTRAPSTRIATAGATFAAFLPTVASTNPRRNSLKRCLCPRTNSVPGCVGSASSTAAFWKGQPRNPGDSKKSFKAAKKARSGFFTFLPC